MVQVETKSSDLRVGEEERFHSTLCQIILDRDVVAEVAIVDQRQIDTLSERMGATRVCDTATGWISVVANPNM